MPQTPADHHILHQRDSTAGTAPWAWALSTHQATTLAADGAQRWLHVDDGCVWLTRADADELASDRDNDIWLVAGDSLALPAGSAWVLEAWPQARLSLLQQAPVAVTRALSSLPLQPGSWLARWLHPSWLRAFVAPSPSQAV